MQIPFKIARKEGTPEWIILELQGDLESRTNEEMASKFIGDLHFTKEGTPILIIGHHIMYGKFQDLDKPFALMHKKKLSTDTEQMDVDDTESQETASSTAGVEYIIQAVIRKKILFKSRPKPIIAVQSANIS
ncbi:chromosome transmission fidelity protein 8 homolog [Penaeus chinensis]|uniref:chromosome transmission fidelity protein 8 homolog n=1 Tax=Penaeus chinensis TaxID=139456 RepID=UPI001FB62CB3|nr:chromosome transmission fidelity protein 8 homolog [Penaeus chinensis]